MLYVAARTLPVKSKERVTIDAGMNFMRTKRKLLRGSKTGKRHTRQIDLAKQLTRCHREIALYS